MHFSSVKVLFFWFFFLLPWQFKETLYAKKAFCKIQSTPGRSAHWQAQILQLAYAQILQLPFF